MSGDKKDNTSPRPWRANPMPSAGAVMVGDADGNYLFICTEKEWMTISRAVNAHDELVEAASAALELWEESVGADEEVPDVVTDLRAALREAGAL